MNAENQRTSRLKCGGNKLCDSLAEDDRARLCAICSLRTYDKGEQLGESAFHRNVMLILDGVLATIKATTGKLQYIYTPCDIFAHEYLFNGEILEYEAYGLIQAIRPLKVAYLPTKELRELFMTRPSIARALYMNLSTMYNQKCFYRLMVEMDDARHAVLYMMLYLQQKNIDPPTHEELAFMTGLNRVTVTRMLKEIYRNENYARLSEYMHANLQED